MTAYPTLVIHGFLTRSITNLPLHVALRVRGIETYDVPIPGLNTQDIALSSAIVEERARAVLAKTGAERIDLVGVSLGGLIALHFLRCRGGHSLVRRTVTVGSPLRGTHVASRASRWLPFEAAKQLVPGSEIVRALAEAREPQHEVVSIYADGDLVASPEAMRIPGVRLLRAPSGHAPFGHYELILHPRNLAFVAEQLLDGTVRTRAGRARSVAA